MNDEEIKRFLLEPHVAKLATLGHDGWPQLTPLWFLYDGRDIVLIAGPDAVKVRNIRRDPRVSVCIDRPTPPYAGVAVRGRATVEIVDYQELAVPMATRYLGAVEGARLGAEYARSDLATIRVPLERVHSWDFGAGTPNL
ncbi:MAG: hypothetical protein NVSMB65_05530 [Chloroflexota bacterium]